MFQQLQIIIVSKDLSVHRSYFIALFEQINILVNDLQGKPIYSTKNHVVVIVHIHIEIEIGKKVETFEQFDLFLECNVLYLL